LLTSSSHVPGGDFFVTADDDFFIDEADAELLLVAQGTQM
jgi:hypothetical protein